MPEALHGPKAVFEAASGVEVVASAMAGYLPVANALLAPSRKLLQKAVMWKWTNSLAATVLLLSPLQMLWDGASGQ